MRAKVILLSAVAAALLSGCAFKSSKVEFTAPTSVYMGEKAYSKAYIKPFEDVRSDKQMLGSIKNKSGEIIGMMATDQNMAQWFGNAFEKEMRAAGFAPVSSEGDADYTYNLSLKKLDAEYIQTEISGKNLHLVMEIEVKILKGGNSVTKQYKYNESKWTKPLFNAESLKDTLEPFVKEGITATVKDLVALSKTK
ncbi:MAG: YajG family lipoprotein [Campylobacterales bacterium]|nr:YajG family lipoprotein [Campylobacterales bacterium]